MNEHYQSLFKDFEFNALPESSVTELNGIRLPDDYIQFLGENGGGEGAVGEQGYLQLWGLSELDENNKLYEASEYFPDCTLIATDLSGALFGITKLGEYFAADANGPDEDIEIMCDTFEEFIEKIGGGEYF